MANMTTSDTEAVMRSMVEMFATGDVSTVLEVVADDYHDHQGSGGVEIRGPHESFAQRLIPPVGSES